MISIVAICGSLKKDSLNKKLLKAVISRAPQDMMIEVMDIQDIPMYNPDSENPYPPMVQVIKDKVQKADAVLFVSPEYNRSIPSSLKNIVDWVSRPYGNNTWEGKPVAVMGASTGNLSTALAHYHLKQILLYLNMQVMGQPEFLVANALKKFDVEGNLIDEKTEEQIKHFFEVFKKHIEVFK